MSLFSSIGSFIGKNASLIGSLGSSVGTIGSALIGARSQRDTNEQSFGMAQYQNAYNYQMYEKQRADALEQWNRENEYNSPKATMQRLVEAGINPRSQSGLGQYANAGNINQPAMPAAAQYDYKSPLASYMSMGSLVSNMLSVQQQLADIDKTNSEASKNYAQGELFSTQHLLESLRNLREQSEYDFWKVEHGYSFDKNGNPKFARHKELYGSAIDRLLSEGVLKSATARYQQNLANMLEEDVEAGVAGINGLWDGVGKLVGRWISRGIKFFGD